MSWGPSQTAQSGFSGSLFRPQPRASYLYVDHGGNAGIYLTRSSLCLVFPITDQQWWLCARRRIAILLTQASPAAQDRSQQWWRCNVNGCMPGAASLVSLLTQEMAASRVAQPKQDGIRLSHVLGWGLPSVRPVEGTTARQHHGGSWWRYRWPDVVVWVAGVSSPRSHAMQIRCLPQRRSSRSSILPWAYVSTAKWQVRCCTMRLRQQDGRKPNIGLHGMMRWW